MIKQIMISETKIINQYIDDINNGFNFLDIIHFNKKLDSLDELISIISQYKKNDHGLLKWSCYISYKNNNNWLLRTFEPSKKLISSNSFYDSFDDLISHITHNFDFINGKFILDIYLISTYKEGFKRTSTFLYS